MNAPLASSARLSDSALQMMQRLIAMDTTSRKSNLEMIDWVADYLSGFGIESRLTFNDERNKANLFATIGPRIDGGIVLSGHTDVVPVDGQAWTSDPWQPIVRDGVMTGLGACDMKGGIAAMLGVVLALARAGTTVTRGLRLDIVIDEEATGEGSRQAVARQPLPGAAVIV